jgi:hypothetical protein
MQYLRDVSEQRTRVCTFRLTDAGFIHAVMDTGARFELADARESVALTWKLAGERRCGVLVDMRGVQAQTREAREYFVSEEVAAKINAVALLVESPVSRMIGNFFLRLGSHRIPTQIFTEEAAAWAWLGEPDR